MSKGAMDVVQSTKGSTLKTSGKWAGPKPTGAGGNTKPYNWLGSQDPNAIAAQAAATITKAYNPAYLDLNQQGKQVRAVNAKRASDNRYYNSWLQTQMKSLQAHQDASNAQLAGLQTQINTSQNALYGGQAGSLVAGANAREGNVSNNAQSATFGPQLAQNQASNQGLMNSAEQQSVGGMRLANAQGQAARSNDVAYIQAAEQKRIADLNTALTTLANARAKLSSSKVADIAKEIARLQGIEIQKAQSNRSAYLAGKELKLKNKDINSLIQTRAGQLLVSQQNANTSAGQLTVAQQNAMIHDKQYQLDLKKYGAAQAQNRYQKAHGLGPYKPASPGATTTGPGGDPGKPASQASQNATYSKISNIQGELQSIMSSNGGNRVAAWHAINNGYYTDSSGKVKYVNKVDVGLLNAAYNSMAGGGGLSPGDIEFLEQNYGVSEPEKRLGQNNGSGSRVTGALGPGGATGP